MTSRYFMVSKIRSDIHSLGVKTYMPEHEIIDTCVQQQDLFKIETGRNKSADKQDA